jgi:maleate cis-trans isomerase
VLTTNQVSLWAALRLAGYYAPVFGWGRLLREFMV